MSCVLNSKSGTHPHLKTLERVQRYPIVNDSFGLALNYYQWAKAKNAILDSTLSRLEGTLKTVKERTEPYATNKLQYLDDKVYNQLERLEKLCPIILEPSKTITEIPSNIFHQRIEPSLHKVVQPISSTLGFVSKTSCVAANLMTTTLTQVIPTAVLPIQTTNTVLNKTEELLDRYLPAQDGDSFEQCQTEDNSTVYGKIKRLSRKTQHRIYKKVITDIDHFRKVSLQKLDRIYTVLQEIKKKNKDSFSNITDTIQYNQLIKDGLQYSEHLQHLITSTVQSAPKFICNNTITVLDLINDKLFLVRNTIQESSSNRSFVSEKRINQAADSIDFVRSWIEYVTDNLKEFYVKEEKKECKSNEEEYSESDSIDENSEGEEDENNHE